MSLVNFEKKFENKIKKKMVSKINNIKKTIAMGFVILMCLGGMAMAHEKVHISEIDTLTLEADKMTTGNRLSSVPQLTCRGKNCQYAPSSVKCTNVGWDGIEVRWDCKAELDNHVEFGDMNVICEGYKYSNDSNILAGSCGLEYTLENVSFPIKFYTKICIFIGILIYCINYTTDGITYFEKTRITRRYPRKNNKVKMGGNRTTTKRARTSIR